MRELQWTDGRGRIWLVALPGDAPDSDAELGVPIGPPDIGDLLGLTDEQAVRLHNELAKRRLWRLRDVQMRPQDVQAAIMAALRVDVVSVVNAYTQLERPEA